LFIFLAKVVLKDSKPLNQFRIVFSPKKYN